MKFAGTFCSALCLAAVGFAPQLASADLLGQCNKFKGSVESLLTCTPCNEIFDTNCKFGVPNMVSSKIGMKIQPCEGNIVWNAKANILGVDLPEKTHTWSPKFPEMVIKKELVLKGFQGTGMLRVGANKLTPGSIDVIAEADACLRFHGKDLSAKALKNLRKFLGMCSKFSTLQNFGQNVKVVSDILSNNRRRGWGWPSLPKPSLPKIPSIPNPVDAIGDVASDVAKKTKEGVDGAVKAAGNAADAVGKAAGNAADAAGNALDAAGNAAKKGAEGAAEAAGNAAGAAGKAAKQAGNYVLNEAGDILDETGNIVKDAAVALNTGTGMLVAGVENGIADVLDFTDDQLEKMLKDPLAYLEGGIDTVDGFCKVISGDDICGKDLAKLAFDNELIRRFVFQGILGIAPPEFPYTIFQHKIVYDDDCGSGNEEQFGWDIDYDNGGISVVKPSYGVAGQLATLPDGSISRPGIMTEPPADVVRAPVAAPAPVSVSARVSVSAISTLLVSAVALVATC